MVKNENNRVKVNVPYALNGFDYGVFMSILNQCKQQSTTADCAGTFCINIPAVAKQLRQQDGGSFRTRFIKSLEALTATSIRYKVLVSEYKLVTGTSFVMNYEIIQWKTHHSLKIKLNELFVKILFQANKNYCIYDLNTEKRLNTAQRYLYGLITNSVAIGKYPKTFEVHKVLQKMYCFVGKDSNYRRKKQYLLKNLHSLAGSGGLRIAIAERKDKFIVTRDKPVIIKGKKKPILF
uniref:Uncharacterized protein n=1 Tax=Palmaria palmata TaxID=2822 RepID=A0A5K7TME7_PALPL|nr:hypothetical protein [Palmaria palmata]